MLGEPVRRLGDRLFAPLNRAGNRLGLGIVAANALEMIAALGAATCFAVQATWPAAALLAAHGVFDYAEGGLRRAAGRAGVSTRSVWRHAAVDKTSDVILLMAIGWGGFAPWPLAITTAVSAVVVTGLGLWLHGRLPALRERAVFDRADRILLLLLATAVGMISWAVWTILAMNVFGVVRRLTVALRSAPRDDETHGN